VLSVFLCGRHDNPAQHLYGFDWRHANTNPIILGTDGGAAIWLLSSSYKFILKDTGGTPIWTVDNVSGLAGFCLKTGCTMTGALVAPTINNVQYPTTFATLQTAVTACSGNPCTIAINTTIAVPSSYSIPSYVTVQFNNGAQLQPANAQVLTISGPIQAPPVRIFGGAGTEALGALVPRAFVQWWGAVADSNHIGGTGTDNTAAIQACLSDVANGSECFVPAGDYKITGTLSLTRSGVSLRGVSSPVTFAAAWATPHPSRIVTTSATANILNVWGSSTAANVTDVFVEHLTLSRGVTSTSEGTGECNATTAIGISSKFNYASVYNNISIEDSATGFYYYATGASAKGYTENSDVIWGSNGISAGTGVYCGYYEDSKDGTASPSLRLRNLDAQAPSVAASHPGLTIYGFAAKGKQMSDIHVNHLETYAIDYGISLVGVGMSGFASATDSFFENCVLDNTYVSAVQVSGLSGYGTLSFLDGWAYISAASASPAFDIQNSGNVTISHQKIYSPSITAPVISVAGAGNEQIVANEIIGGTAGAIKLDTSPANVISGNIVSGQNNWGTNIISLVNSSVYNTIANNVLNGTATNGISADVTSTSNGGLETNSIGDPALGTITNILNVSPNNFTPIYNGLRMQSGSAILTGDQGNGALIQHSTGVPTPGDLTAFDANSNTVDAGIAATGVPQRVVTCGSSTTCGNTPQPSPRIVWGTVVLSSGSPSTAVVTGMTAWTATSSYACTVSNMTTQADPVKVSNTSTTSITISGPNTVTDTVSYICVGN
jgi:hypothetical protein